MNFPTMQFPKLYIGGDLGDESYNEVQRELDDSRAGLNLDRNDILQEEDEKELPLAPEDTKRELFVGGNKLSLKSKYLKYAEKIKILKKLK